MISTLLRVLFGFVLACLTAGLVQVLFALPPGAILSAPASEFAQRAGQLGDLTLLAATHAAIFSVAFALIAASVGEWTGTRALAYYLFAGIVIAMLGFAAQYASEAPGAPTVLNNYALKAFLTSGFFAGFVYWLIAGQAAGRRAHGAQGPSLDEGDTIGVPPPSKNWKNRPKLVIDDAPKPGNKDARKASLAERLSENETDSLKQAKAEAKAVADATSPGANDKVPAAGPKETVKADATAKAAETSGSQAASKTSVPSTKSPDGDSI